MGGVTTSGVWPGAWRGVVWRSLAGSDPAVGERGSSLLTLPAAMERLTLPPGGAAAVDEYLEYRR